MHPIDYCLHATTPVEQVVPSDAEAVGAVLQAATAAGNSVIPWGAGTRQHLCAAPERYDIALDLRELNQVIDYSPADLVISVQAGATLGAIQTVLAAHGQWLPWDPPLSEQATIGGLLASAAAGPLRLGYGAPRDWTLGMQVALGDGRLVRSGAKVVKNVAGYDAHKLHLGAFGTLGVIVEATCKVAPLPADRATLLALFPDRRSAVAAMEQVRAAPLQPIALVALNASGVSLHPVLAQFSGEQSRPILVAARFAGTAAAVQRQICTAAGRCTELGAHTVEPEINDDTAIWAAIADFNAPLDDGSCLIRVGAAVSALPSIAQLLEHVPQSRGWPAAHMLFPGVGIGYTRWQVTPAALPAYPAALDELRAAMRGLGGYAVVEEAPTALAAQTDRWGQAPATIEMMHALRQQWDPARVLNPGRYLVP